MKLYDKVRIKSTGITGTIVDITERDGCKNITVESDIPDLKEGYGGKWKLFDCKVNEVEPL